MATARVFFDGTLARPQLDHPECVAVHPDGSLWCGGESGQIFRIAADGTRLDVVASTDGFVLGVAFGPDADLYACDLRHRAVFRVDTVSGAVTRRWRAGAALRHPELPGRGPDGSEEVAEAIADLASPLSGSTTGTVLAVDGGLERLSPRPPER